MKRYTFFVSTILIFSFSLVAQNNLLFYNFDAVNQNSLINPSDQHDYRLVVGIPGISGISAHYTNTVFKAGEFFNDKDLTENLDNIIPNLDGNERINFYENIDLLYVGLGLKKGFLSFGIQQEATLNMVMPAKL